MNLFGRLGYEKTSVDQIARLARKAKASIYYHFDSKLSIYRDVMEDEFRTLRKSLEDVRERCTEDEAECLSEYLMVRMEEMLKMPIYANYMKDRIVNHTLGEVSRTVRSIRKDFDEWEYRYFRHVGEGLEIQLFVTDDRDALRSTYEAMVEILIYRNPALVVCRQANESQNDKE